jgi:hypothetical protein
MRNLPRFALVPLAVLVTAAPLLGPASPAGADTAPDCESVFAAAPAEGLTYLTDPPQRLAWTGQTVRLSAAWDPAAWDSLSSAAACVEVDDAVDDSLGTSRPADAAAGAFDPSFTIPEVAAGTRLCTRVRLAGDPAGEAAEAVWVSKTHCFEVDHDEEEAPPAGDDTAPPQDDTTTPPAEQPPTTTPTAPAASPAPSADTPAGDTPAGDTPEVPVTPEGSGGPVGTPFDTADTPRTAGAPVPTELNGAAVPRLPATGYASLRLLHQGELLLVTGLALLVASARSRRRRQTA